MFALFFNYNSQSIYFFNPITMLYAQDLPEQLTHAEAVAASTQVSVDGHHRPENETDQVSSTTPRDSGVFDRLHEVVYQKVQPETHGERLFLTRCLRAVLETGGQWTEEETMKVLNVLLESREGAKVVFRQEEFTNNGFPDCQVA